MKQAWLSDSARLFLQGLSFCFLRAPKSRTPISGFSSFLLIAFLFAMLFTTASYIQAGERSIFFASAYGGYALLLLALLAASALGANVIKRQSLWLSLASITLVTVSGWTLILIGWTFELPFYEVPGSDAAKIVLGILLLCLMRIYAHFMQPRQKSRVVLAGVFCIGILYWPWSMNLQQSIFLSFPTDEEFNELETAGNRSNFDSELVFSAQPELLEKQLSLISNQNPKKIDLYAIGVAGDGSERVFRNEVEYLEKLLPLRLNAHYLPLINTLESKQDTAIASFTNLKNALHGFSKKMDIQQDILLVYLTSHGGEDHKFLLQLGNLPLTQITPGELDLALGRSGIKHQIIIISACYSGGYIEPLRNEHRLIITAARKDRTSFGCGADSEITWFGKAFWAEAMNEHNDFEKAFIQAKNHIGKWEANADYPASEPQMSMGKEMRKHLQLWQEQLPTSWPKLPFFIASKNPAKPQTKVPQPAKDTPGYR